MKIIKILFLVVFVTAVWAQPRSQWDYTNPQEYIIGEITVSGIKFLDPNAIVALTGLKKGDKINVPGDVLTSAIKKIWDQGLVGDVQVKVSKVEGRMIYLDFVLTERPRLSQFVFVRGVRKGEQDDILEKINHAKGAIVTDAMIKAASKKIKDFYVEKGFLNTKVNIVQERDSSLANSVALKIAVEREKKIHIKDIQIEGNNVFSDGKIKRKLKKTHERHWYTFFWNSKFNALEYKADKERVVALYNNKGYRDMSFTFDTTYSLPKNKMGIKLKIQEGNQYYFRNITWTGNYVYPTSVLDSILRIKKGQVYSEELLQSRLNFNPNGVDVSSIYMDNGYLFFSIEPVEVAIVGDSVDIEMRIYEGKQAVIDKITISGNTKTHDHVILRELYTLPGQRFSRSDLIRSQRQIATLGYFDPEKIDIQPRPNQEKGTVDIHYVVEEKPSDQIQLSGGWGGGSRNSQNNPYAFGGFVGTLGLVFNNFSVKNITKLYTWDPLPSGDGQKFSVNFQSNGRSYQNYSASFMEPWFGGRKPISFSVSGYHTRINRFNYTSEEWDQHLYISTFSLGLGRRLKQPDDYFSINHTLSYTIYDYRNYSNFLALSSDTGKANNLVFSTTISRSCLDEFQFPTRGSNLSLAINLTPPYSLFRKIDYADPSLLSSERFKFVEYHKWMFDADFYTTLISGKERSLVLRTKANFGFIGMYNSLVGVSPFERFVMGGNGFMGFGLSGLVGTDLIGLRGYDNGVLPADQKYVNVGGTAYDKFTVELRYPIASSQALSLSVHTFFEAGNVWIQNNKFNPFDVYRASGFGARIFMPAFGLIGLDYGFPMDRIPGVINADGNRYKGVFTFSIGQQLR